MEQDYCQGSIIVEFLLQLINQLFLYRVSLLNISEL
jgi:hypothetical protein